MTMIVMTIILTRLMAKSSRVAYVDVNPLVHDNLSCSRRTQVDADLDVRLPAFIGGNSYLNLRLSRPLKSLG